MAGQTQLSAKLGMDNKIFKHDIPAKVDRSSFPYGRKRDFCIDPGMIVPIDLFETLPGDYFEVDLQYLLKSFPLKVPPFTTYRVRTHWYYCKKVDLWKGALTYMVKGRSHSISLSNPKLNVHTYYALPVGGHGNNYYYSDVPMGLPSFMGFQPGRYPNSSIGNYCVDRVLPLDSSSVSSVHEFYGGVNALPFFMYQKIYRFAYIKPNLLQDNKVWFPDDMSDGWRINYSKDNLLSNKDMNSSLSVDNKVFFIANASKPSDPGVLSEVPSVNDKAVNILQLRYSMFEDDRFTTALPWSTRGTAPSVDVDGSATVNIGGLQLESDSKLAELIVNFQDNTDFSVTANKGSVTATTALDLSIQNTDKTISGFGVDLDEVANALTTSDSTRNVTINSLGFDINDLRAKIALTVWQERNATTQGYYNEMIYAHFNENPDSQDFEPRYLGGTSDVISFSEVIQHDNSDSDNTPQGHAAGLGQTASGGHVFSYRCKDYGYIMGVMIIQPETIYNSQIEKLWLREIQEDEYFPEFQGIGLREILKGEIYPTGTSTDKDLFGYQEPDTEYKTRNNQSNEEEQKSL